jgi:hypothetical protein
MSGAGDAAAVAESPTSRFTAVNVNGKEQPPSTAPPSGSGVNGISRRGSDERSNGQPRITPPGQEKLTITTTTNQEWAAPPNGDRQPYQPPLYSDTESSHKRKRSGSIEQNSSSANSYHSHALPSSTKETPTTATTESDGPREESLRGHSQPEMRDSYAPEVHYRQYNTPSEDSHGHTPGDLWHSRQYSQTHINSDEQLGEVLQRASQSMDQQREYDHMSPGNDRSAGPYSAYPNDQREMSAQSDPKKRKRNFSNRTKTGCMTCRRRKKKCDETRPECELCRISYKQLGMTISQVITVFVVALSARDTSNEVNGQRPNRNSPLFLCNRRPITRHKDIASRHIHPTIWLQEENPCLGIEVKPCASTHSMEDHHTMMINQVPRLFPVPLAQRTTDCLLSHMLNKHRHLSVL